MIIVITIIVITGRLGRGPEAASAAAQKNQRLET